MSECRLGAWWVWIVAGAVSLGGGLRGAEEAGDEAPSGDDLSPARDEDPGVHLDLTIGNVGVGLGNSPRIHGLRFNLRDEGVEEVSGLNLTLWSPGENPESRVRGVALGLAAPAARDITGLALGLGAVVSHDSLRGIALGGLTVIDQGEMTGVEAALIATIAQGRALGLRMAGVASVSQGEIYGVNLSGVATVSQGSFTGVNASGVATVSQGDLTGLHLSGLATVCQGHLTGLHLTGLVAVNQGRHEGVSLAGVATVSQGGRSGIHLAGLAGISSGSLHGVDIAGFGIQEVHVEVQPEGIWKLPLRVAKRRRPRRNCSTSPLSAHSAARPRRPRPGAPLTGHVQPGQTAVFYSVLGYVQHRRIGSAKLHDEVPLLLEHLRLLLHAGIEGKPLLAIRTEKAESLIEPDPPCLPVAPGEP